jgi:hydrogenase/urease accessory protein HupE
VKALFAVITLLGWLWSGDVARAHALDPAFLELQSLGGDSWRVLWKVPLVEGQPMAIDVALPESCTPREVPPLSFDGRSFAAIWVVTCPGGIEGGLIAIPGLDSTRTDVLVRYELIPGSAESYRLTPGAPSFTVPEPLGSLGVLLTYGQLGVTHILTGADHLLFVFVLLLLIRDRRTLLGAVTAFTVAHSLSLAAATLGWIVVAAPPVEAIVALSIMFLAAELLRAPGTGLRLTERYPWSVAFAFGLLHGLGFASALRDIGLPEGEVPLALLSFNIGVEIGQIMFIAFVLIGGALLRRLYPAVVNTITTRGQTGSRIVGYAVGCVAAVWFVARLAVF